MNYSEYRDWVSHYIGVKGRIKKLCTGYILFLMVSVCKHSLDEASLSLVKTPSDYKMNLAQGNI